MKIYIGYDSTNYGQEVAYRVCKRSIENHSAEDVEVYPIKLKDMYVHGYNRGRDKKQSTEFTYTRFLSPYLAEYKGAVLFCDSDFLWRVNALEILNFIDSNHSVSCVRHEYTECPSKIKMDGIKQEWYPKKNWSSLMLFNANHEDCKKLTPGLVSSETAKYLHRMEWTTEEKIGSIPIEYNYLVGYYRDKKPKALHFTDGGPWHKDYQDVEYKEEWLAYLTEEEKKEYEKGLFWIL
jgi:hypothetical protein